MSSNRVSGNNPPPTPHANNATLNARNSPPPPSSLPPHVNGNQTRTASRPSVPATSSVIVRRGDTPLELERRALTNAARRAGLPPSERASFANANASGSLIWVNTDPSPENNRSIRRADLNLRAGTTLEYQIPASLQADLRKRQSEYVARGGRLYSGREAATPNEQVALQTGIDRRLPNTSAPNGTTPNNSVTSTQLPGTNTTSINGVDPIFGQPQITRQRVTFANDGRRIDAERTLLQYVQERYGQNSRGGNLWGDNIREIADTARQQGVRVENMQIQPMGNQRVVDFDLRPGDAARIERIYQGVQERVNRTEAIVNDFRNNNEVASFLRGVGQGAWSSLKGTWEMVTDPVGTLRAVWGMVSDPVGTYQNLKQQLSESWTEFRNAPPGRQAEMAGELVGQAVVEILLGKGAGRAAGILRQTRAGQTILNRADDVARQTGRAIAGAFSDEAAQAAAQRVRQRLRQMNTQLNAGLPIDPQLLADMAVVAGNKLQRGAVRFSEFTRQMAAELGDGVKSHMRDLEQVYRDTMQRLGFGNQIDEGDIRVTSRMAQMQVEREARAARQQLLDGIKDAENRPSYRTLSSGDRAWLNADPRRKELAYDPDTKSFKVREAQAALRAEERGVLRGPVTRAIDSSGRSRGGDVIDGNGRAWDVKEARDLDAISAAANGGEAVLVNAMDLTPAELQNLRNNLRPLLNANAGEIRYVTR